MSKHAWFQIHLSTAVILSLTAGALMLLNFRERTERKEIFVPGPPYEPEPFQYEINCGWPLWVRRTVKMDYASPAYLSEGRWNFNHLALNASIGAALLVFVVLLLQSESRARLAALRGEVHLASVICALLVFGIFVWVNVRGNGARSFVSGYDVSGAIFDPVISIAPQYGWPMRCDEYGVDFAYAGQINLPYETRQWKALPLLANAALVLALSALVLFACERFRRRRQRRVAHDAHTI